MDKQTAQRICDLASSLIIQEQVSLYLHGKPNAAMFALMQIIFDKNKLQQLYVGESRPVLWSTYILEELKARQIPCTLLCDSAAAHLYKYAPIDWLLLGGEKIAANGDLINTVGSYQLALMAKQQQIRTLVLVASQSIDEGLVSGEDADIEQGDMTEVLKLQEPSSILKYASVANPVYDITPASLIDAIVTEKGLILSPNADAMSVQFT